MLFKLRFKYLDDYTTIKLHTTELKRFKVNSDTLHQLAAKGEIWYDSEGNFKALQSGAIDITLIKKKSVQLTPLNNWMREHLRFVELPTSNPKSSYFDTFIQFRDKQLNMFFTVDEFCGRVHTPITSLQRDLRPLLRLYGEAVISLDVAQMQPTLLAKILTANVGENVFSKAIDDGTDVYVLLQQKANLSTRDEAKKLLFKILFGFPSKALAEIFGDAEWINWINDYKSRTENRNSHSSKPHTNLAWLLQNSEVRIMSQVWQKMAENGLPFLSVHDEIICRQSDELKAQSIFNNELSKYFINFNITLK